MRQLIGLVATSMLVAFPALSQEAAPDTSTMTCADFSGMDATAQAGAMASLQVGGAGEASDSTTAATAGDASGAAASTEGTSGGTTTGVAGSDATAGTTGQAALPGDMLTALQSACADNPDMMVTDAMAQAQSGNGAAGETTGSESATGSGG
ncbi:hypothetical protein [Rubellimicrobium arenae]|uniref:hypothetical protein n=1 Tax=Rubellimicrobium arenae TaxID=2817372 RepID=UPI001B31702B|nr:hypothetical protein [Rubellimicrobium arenae]